MDLKWLFTAFYSDGGLLQQLPSDVSTQDPKRSAFFDVDHDRLVAFSLINQENGDSVWVDLLKGKFLINSLEVGLHDQDIPVLKRTLVFFRRHLHTIAGLPQDLKEIEHRVTYHIGWSGTTEKGEEIERTVWIE